ncbi:MAG: F0F1 ATP synthase subunit A [Myxococcota bacterium]
MASPEQAAEALPEHWSWFSLLPESFSSWAHSLGAPFNDEGQRWFFGGHIGTLHVWALIAVVLVLTVFGLLTSSKLSDTKAAVVPEDKLSVATFVELMTIGVYNMMAGMMGKKAAKYFLPLIGTCAFVIFFSNVMGLIPGFLPPTDTLTTTAAMAGVIFFATHIYGVKENGFAYFKHFLGPVWWLSPLILAIELVSHIVRPVTLCIRLTANMFADHAVLTVFLSLLSGTAMLLTPIVALPVYVLGCLVVTIQTLVFCLLSTVYISMAIEHHEEH